MISPPAGQLRTILLAGIAGAVLIDLYLVVSLGLILHSTRTTLTLSQWDASNVLGRAAFDGGVASAVLGFGMHLVVSTIWAAVFAFFARRIPFLGRHPVLSGIGFGMLVMTIMTFVIVPLGHAQAGASDAWGWLNRAVAHTLFFGVPVAVIVSGRADKSLHSTRT